MSERNEKRRGNECELALEAQGKIIKWKMRKRKTKSESPGVVRKSAEEPFDKPDQKGELYQNQWKSSGDQKG